MSDKKSLNGYMCDELIKEINMVVGCIDGDTLKKVKQVVCRENILHKAVNDYYSLCSNSNSLMIKEESEKIFKRVQAANKKVFEKVRVDVKKGIIERLGEL